MPTDATVLGTAASAGTVLGRTSGDGRTLGLTSGSVNLMDHQDGTDAPPSTGFVTFDGIDVTLDGVGITFLP